MSTVNIFASSDVRGILAHKKTPSSKTVQELIVEHYSFDPMVVGIITESEQINQLVSNAANPLRFGWTDYHQIPDYVRLISSKSSSEGYKISNEDIKNGRVTSTYELQVSANEGDRLIWWGHTIDPLNQTQCIVSNISRIRDKAGSHITVPEIDNSNVSFYFASRGAGIKPSDGIRVETNSTYTTELTIPSGWGNKVISYDIEILLLSSPCNTSSGLLSYPIAKLVVDPTINLK